MSGRAAYLDTSAFLKLVVEEPESSPLQRHLARFPERVSATLLRAEAVRALRRSDHTESVGPARRLMSTMRLVRLDETLLDRAGELEPLILRTLDSVHLAAALTVGADLGTFLTYDQRLAGAAEAAGLPVESPA